MTAFCVMAADASSPRGSHGARIIGISRDLLCVRACTRGVSLPLKLLDTCEPRIVSPHLMHAIASSGPTFHAEIRFPRHLTTIRGSDRCLRERRPPSTARKHAQENAPTPRGHARARERSARETRRSGEWGDEWRRGQTQGKAEPALNRTLTHSLTRARARTHTHTHLAEPVWNHWRGSSHHEPLVTPEVPSTTITESGLLLSYPPEEG